MRGFSLVEAILVVLFITIVAALAFPFSRNLLVATYSQNVARDIVETLRRTQAKAQGSEMDSLWGVHVETNRLVIFKGSLWATRDNSFDEEYTVASPSSLNSVPTDIVFGKRGTTSTESTVNITRPDGVTQIITISKEGVITL